MADYRLHTIFYILTSVLGLAVLHWTVHKVLLSISRSKFKKANNCQPIPKYANKDPIFGYDYWHALKKAAESRTLLSWLREQYRLYGNTYYARLQTANVISTCDPENLKAMHSTKFKDFAIDSRRKFAFLPLLGAHSVLLANGAAWEHKRAVLKPSFSRSQYTNLPLFERHVGHLIEAVRVENTKKGQVDLAEFFLCLTVDITSELMYGTSIELLTNGNKDLVRDMTQSAEGGHARWLLVFLANIIGNSTFSKSVSKVRNFMKRFVDEAISYRQHSESRSISAKPTARNFEGQQGTEPLDVKGRVIYLQQLSLGTRDRKAILDELTTILFAGRDTTAALLTNLFFVLAHRSDIYDKLRAEISVLDGERPTFEQLKGFNYLQSCLNEALRLYPVIPINTRMAVVDTTLPVGGGPKGQSPVFVSAGTNIAFHVTALHRRKDLWGEDAEDFLPERWEKIQGQGAWMYQPFGGGPRNCPGQHLSLAEAAYTVLRIVQEFSMITGRDSEPWTELIALTCTNANGAKVTLTEA